MNKRTNCRHASLRRLTTLCVGLVLASILGVAAHARSANYQSLTANLGDVRIHYLKAGAVGFGELSIEHLSLPQSPVKDYEYAPADSPLMPSATFAAV